MTAEQSKRTFKLQVWQMILVPILLALIPLLYPEIKVLFARKQPQFIIENPIISKGDSVLHIFAENTPARKKEDLNIEVEGLEFRDAGTLVREDPLEWEFNFTRYGIPETLFTEGLNVIRIGFPTSVSYDDLKVYVRPNFYQKDDFATNEGDLQPRPSFIDSTSQQYEQLTNDVKKISIVSNIMDNDARVGITTSALLGMGLNAVGYEDRGHYKDKDLKGSEIRYFHGQDERKAEELALMLEKDLKIPVTIKNVGKELPKTIAIKSKGQFEIVLDKQ